MAGLDLTLPQAAAITTAIRFPLLIPIPTLTVRATPPVPPPRADVVEDATRPSEAGGLLLLSQGARGRTLNVEAILATVVRAVSRGADEGKILQHLSKGAETEINRGMSSPLAQIRWTDTSLRGVRL